jgi:signal-transduction protein with cAMP-binding, CBS, and nucleotidyltransferase domain
MKVKIILDVDMVSGDSPLFEDIQDSLKSLIDGQILEWDDLSLGKNLNAVIYAEEIEEL